MLLSQARTGWFQLQFSSKKVLLHGNNGWLLTLVQWFGFCARHKVDGCHSSQKSPHLTEMIALKKQLLRVLADLSSQTSKQGSSSQPAVRQRPRKGIHITSFSWCQLTTGLRGVTCTACTAPAWCWNCKGFRF